MELRGKLAQVAYTVDGKPSIRLDLERMGDINKIAEMDPEQRVKIKITELGKSRTNLQNALMWAIISDIDRAENGIPTEKGRWKIYLHGLESIGVEFEDLIIRTENVEYFTDKYRTCRVLNEFDGKSYVRCYIGSSRFTKAQMSELIDGFIRHAAEYKIPTIDYIAERERIF